MSYRWTLVNRNSSDTHKRINTSDIGMGDRVPRQMVQHSRFELSSCNFCDAFLYCSEPHLMRFGRCIYHVLATRWTQEYKRNASSSISRKGTVAAKRWAKTYWAKLHKCSSISNSYFISKISHSTSHSPLITYELSLFAQWPRKGFLSANDLWRAIDSFQWSRIWPLKPLDWYAPGRIAQAFPALLRFNHLTNCTSHHISSRKVIGRRSYFNIAHISSSAKYCSPQNLVWFCTTTEKIKYFVPRLVLTCMHSSTSVHTDMTPLDIAISRWVKFILDHYAHTKYANSLEVRTCMLWEVIKVYRKLVSLYILSLAEPEDWRCFEVHKESGSCPWSTLRTLTFSVL